MWGFVGAAGYVQLKPMRGLRVGARARNECSMFVKAGRIAGAVLGWGTAIGVAVSGALPFERQNAVMLLSLSVGLLCSACMALQKHQRPLGSAFELGYDEGRRDAIRELTKRSNVAPLRRAKGGLSEFAREQVGS